MSTKTHIFLMCLICQGESIIPDTTHGEAISLIEADAAHRAVVAAKAPAPGARRIALGPTPPVAVGAGIAEVTTAPSVAARKGRKAKLIKT